MLKGKKSFRKVTQENSLGLLYRKIFLTQDIKSIKNVNIDKFDNIKVFSAKKIVTK